MMAGEKLGRRSGFIEVAMLLLIGVIDSAEAEQTGHPLVEEIVRSTGIRCGLCVHLCPGDGTLTAALSCGGKFVVHGLSPDPKSVEKARQYIQSQGLYGDVSVERRDLSRLPYVDNLVNLVVADDLPGALAAGLSLSEVMRVLVPKGIAYLGRHNGALSEQALKAKLKAAGIKEYEIVKRDGLWARIGKPRPKEMDEWTHPRHGPDGNAVSLDTLVRPATGLQWMAGPYWLGLHIKKGFGGYRMGEAVSAKGRLFAVMIDSVEFVLKGKERRILIARDAFNGVLLWTRSDLDSEHVVATGERVYGVVGSSLVALDAATGGIVTTYGKTGSAAEIACLDGLLVTSEGFCIEAETGRLRWRRPAGNELLYKYLLAGNGGVFMAKGNWKKLWGTVRVFEAREILCLDLRTGREIWRKRPKENLHPRAVCSGFLVLSGEKGVHVWSTKDGKPLWSHDHPYSHHVRLRDGNTTHLILNGQVWAFTGDRKQRWIGLDLASGKLVAETPLSKISGGYCSSKKATAQYLLGDLGKGFTKSTCGFGDLPANGMLYTFSHGCRCSPFLHGPVGLSSRTPPESRQGEGGTIGQMQKGPAYGRIEAGGQRSAEDWPCYRHDALKSNSTPASLPEKLKTLWKVRAAKGNLPSLRERWLENRGSLITPPVVAKGLVVVAVPDEHRIAACDAHTGKLRWDFTAGARVDLPPTYHNGRWLFGCRDGWVYCLRASDGKLAWRTLVAPLEHRIVVDGQLESIWPVPGSVLIQDNLAYVAAGRHTMADGGIWVSALNPEAGNLVWTSQPPGRIGRRRGEMLADSLASDGESIFLGRSGQCRFDARSGKLISTKPLKTLFVPPGSFTDYQIILKGTLPSPTGRMVSGLWYKTKEGLLQVFDRNRVYALKAQGMKAKTGRFFELGKLELFAKDILREGEGFKVKDGPAWTTPVVEKSYLYTALLSTNDALYVGIILMKDGQKGAYLLAFSKADGDELAVYDLDAPPVFDGLAAAGGRLYVSLEDGRLLCMGAR